MRRAKTGDPRQLRALARWWATLAADEPEHPLTPRRLGLAVYFEDLAREQDMGARLRLVV